MRNFERCQSRQRVRTCVPDRRLRAEGGSRYPDLELDPHRGATARYLCAKHAGTMALTVRPGRRTGAREKPASLKEPVDAQCVDIAQACVLTVAINGCVRTACRWESTAALAFISRRCKIRLDMLRPKPSENFWPVTLREQRKPDWKEKRCMQSLRTFGRRSRLRDSPWPRRSESENNNWWNRCPIRPRPPSGSWKKKLGTYMPR
eukprot:6393477-Pyramimonas_sp.AAC.1